ncbi:MAG: hypothetical protein C0476_07245, partial [Sphingomonas sp.]|nr:hypothetical protein [Sphingomonas sp.]
MTSAVLLVGAPINLGGLSLEPLAEQLRRAEAQQAALQSTLPAQAAPTAPASAPDTETPVELTNPPQAATPSATDPEVMEMTVTGRKKTPGDPLERANALSFEVTQAVDRA